MLSTLSQKQPQPSQPPFTLTSFAPTSTATTLNNAASNNTATTATTTLKTQSPATQITVNGFGSQGPSVSQNLNAASVASTTSQSTSAVKNENGAKAVEAISSLRGKTLEDILREWQDSLNVNVATFHQKAQQVARLDMKLLEQSDQVSFSLDLFCYSLI